MTPYRSVSWTSLAAALALAMTALPVPAGEASSWTQWGGPNRDFTVEATLAASWPEAGPPQLWSREIGVGYSGVLAEDGRLYTMYRDGEDEIVVALDAATGKSLWERRYAAPLHDAQSERFGGGPNATPLIVGDRLITIGFTSRLHALNKSDGGVAWSRDLVQEFGGTKLAFGYASSPLLHDGRVIVLVGGERHAAVAFDPSDGSVTWKSEPAEISFSSPEVIDVDGQEQLVFMSPTEVIGVELDSGEIAWRHPHENQYKTNCAGPWWGEDNLLFVASQGDAGSRTLKLTRKDGATTVEEVFSDIKMKIFHNSAIRQGEWIYGGSRDFLTAYNVRTGETGWKERGFSEANVLLAADKAILFDETGKLALVSLSPEKLEVHASVQLMEKPSWTPPTLVGSQLILRDKSRLMALDLGAAASAAEPARP